MNITWNLAQYHQFKHKRFIHIEVFAQTKFSPPYEMYTVGLYPISTKFFYYFVIAYSWRVQIDLQSMIIRSNS